MKDLEKFLADLRWGWSGNGGKGKSDYKDC